MTILRCLFVAALVHLLDSNVQAQKLEVSLRLHTDTVTFGDPLYVEVTVVNHGSKVIEGPRPDYASGALGFRIYDPERDLMTAYSEGAGMMGGEVSVNFAPNEPIKRYKYFFLPNLRRIESPFWCPVQKQGRRLEISAVYRPYPHVALLSKRHELVVEPRDESELQVLKQMRDAEISVYEKGPSPNSFGITFSHTLPRAWTFAVAEELQAGELKDLLNLVIMLQDLYVLPAESREKGNRELLEWLRDQPEIKREALIDVTFDGAKGNNMQSTVDAIIAEFSIK